jgi:hypothetical protein
MTTFPPTFNRVGTAPILTKPLAAPELIWASVIRTDTLIPEDSLMKYYLYASPHNETGTGVYLYGADSLDGPWYLYQEPPIVAKEIVSGATHISSPFIIWNPDTSKFHLYFHASRTYGDTTNQETFLATSSDGITFTLSGSTPVIPIGTSGSFDYWATSYACVIKDGATWRLIYNGANSSEAHIGYATSADGITWTKQGPLTFEGQGWSDQGVGMLMKVDGVYYIFESRLADTYLWSSTNLSTWTSGGTVLSPKSGAWDAGMVGYAFVIQSDVNGAYYLFYNGAAHTYGDDITLATANIGMAEGAINSNVGITTVPTATTTVYSLTKGIGKTETTIPTATADDYALVKGIGKTETTVPTGTTAATIPTKTIVSNIVITTVPTCTTITIAPTFDKSSVWEQTAVPTATADDYAVVNGITQIETTVPTATTATPSAVKGIGLTEVIIPTATTAAITPAKTVVSNIVITTTPTATADDYAVVKGVGKTETTVPTATADEYAPTLTVISTIVITIVPTATADDYAVTKNIGKPETTVPTGTTASPSVVKGIGVTETIIPSATADDYTVVKGVSVTETIIPTGTTAAITPTHTVSFVITMVPTAAADDYAVAKGIGKTETAIPTCNTTTPTISKGGRVTVFRPTATTIVPSVMVVFHIRFARKTSRVVGTLPATTARMPGTLPATTARMLGTLQLEDVI